MAWFKRDAEAVSPVVQRDKADPGEAATWEPIFTPDFEVLIPPRELWVGPEDPISHFLRWPWEYRAYLTLLCGLRADSRVLEIGCNHGRTMLGLIGLVQPPGYYEGLDIMPAQIAFAQREIQQRYPHMRFAHADIYNGTYNPSGAYAAESFRFPFEESAFDIAYAASVFTHMLPNDAANYLKQTHRVLRPGGCCLYSFFLLDRYNGPGTSSCELYEFNHPLAGEPGVAAHDADHPEAVIAYSRERIGEIALEAGLVAERFLPGFWTPSDEVSANEQDLVLLRRPE